MKHKKSLMIILISLILISLACGSLEVGVVKPTLVETLITAEVTEEPTPEMSISLTLEESSITEEGTITESPEDFSHLWVEYWNPVLDYGLALPSHWLVETEPEGGFMSTRSYDMDFFNANSIKGNWIGGEAPDGAVKLDFVPFQGIDPEQTLSTATSDTLGSDPEMAVVLSVEEISIGNQEAVEITTARPYNLEDTTTSMAFRLSPEIILLVAAYPSSGLFSDDVQTILSTLVLDKSTPIIKPTKAPHPLLTVKGEISGPATADDATAWYGHIASLPAGDAYDDKVVFPFNAGEFGIKGNTPVIETQIQSLRDAAGDREYVHLWGVLYCNIDDYNTCQLNVDRLEYEGEDTVASSPIEKWVGTIQRTTIDGKATYAFVLSDKVPMWYGISSPNDQTIQDQIEALADSDTLVNVWGDLLVGVDDVNGTRIEVTQIDPPAPGGLPSSAACELGYLSSVDEALEFIQYNLEIGNYWPFSYFIGDPFVTGYWQSEGVAIPRDQAFQQLTEQYLPSPEEVVIITDKNEYPNLLGMSVDNVFGPGVEVAATLYSQGWGVDGQGEAILYIARCHENTYDAYYWHGMLFAGDGFE
jgi:hypothetical protein